MEPQTATQITTSILIRGMLLFAILDACLIPLMAWIVKPPEFEGLRSVLPIATAVFYFGLWLWAVIVYWPDMYAYFFPSWSRWAVPAGQGIFYFLAASISTALALRCRRLPAVTFGLLGGGWGILTHTWAVWRGLVDKPPMLQGASPPAAIGIAFFEFTFYFSIATLISWMLVRLFPALRNSRAGAEPASA
jgi:hypothetical protein